MQGTNRILVLRLRGGCCSQVEQPFWKSLFLLSWFRLEPLSYGGGVTTPPLLVAGRATCLCITDAPQVWPAHSLLGTPGSATIRAPPTDFMGDSEREREIAWKPCSLLLVLGNDHRSVPIEIQHSIYCPSMHTYTTTLLTH